MAVEGEWAWPRCIGCARELKKKRPRDHRYGMDVFCKSCMNRLSGGVDYKIAWPLRNAHYTLQEFQKAEAHGDSIPEVRWQKLATDYALAWSRLRDHCLMPEFPAGLELFLVEIHNIRLTGGR